MPFENKLEAVICQYEVSILLTSEGMIIRLYCPRRRRTFEARLPYLLEGKSKEIQEIFVNLDEFFLYIQLYSQDKNRISINDKGTITITYFLIRTSKVVPPVIYIHTQILTAGQKIKNETKLHREITDVRRENLVIQNKINQLMKISEKNLNQIEELKNLVKKGQPKYQNSSDSSQEDRDERPKKNKKKKNKKKYSVISGGGQQGLKELGNTILELNKDIEFMKAKIQTTEFQNSAKRGPRLGINPAMVAESNYLSQQEIFGQRMHITVDSNNPYIQKEFRIQGNRIQKIGKYNRIQLLSREVIPPYGKHYFCMFIEKISYQIFSLGIVNQTRRGYKNSHQTKELISYFAKTGAIWQYNPTKNMPCRSGGPKIPNGVEIRIVVDMNKYEIKWYMDKCQIASTIIQKHLRSERLVAYLQVNYLGDVVYWNEKTPDIQQ